MWPFKGKNKSDKLQAKADAKAGVVTAPVDANETKDLKDNKKDKQSSTKSVSSTTGVDSGNVSILNLSEQLNVAKEAQAHLRQDIET